MSRFLKLSQTIWHCQYHIIWVPKYRYRVLSSKIAREVENPVRAFSEQLGCEIIELNVQIDHVHFLVLVPPKVSISGYMGTINGRTAIRIFNKFRKLKEKPYWGKVAVNGEKALKIASSENPPDIILLDIEMPIMDGYEVCSNLKAHPQNGIFQLFSLRLNPMNRMKPKDWS